MLKLFRWSLLGLAGLAGVWLVSAVALVFSPEPTFSEPATDGAGPEALSTGCQPGATARCWSMRDGTVLASQWLEGRNTTTIVLFHGVMNGSVELSDIAEVLHEITGATVVNVDLRGHGRSGGRPGDIDYIG